MAGNSFPYLLLLVVNILNNPSLAQNPTITCGQTIDGYMSVGEEFLFDFDPVPGLQIFHTCDSGTEFYTILQLFPRGGSQLAYGGAGSGCSRSPLGNLSWTYDPYAYAPGTTFFVYLWSTYTQSAYGSGYWSLTRVCPEYTPTSAPSPQPTYSPLPPGQYPGRTLIARGFNIFMAEPSGSPILEVAYTVNNTESHTTEGATCSYASLSFSNMFTSYTEFAESNSASVAVDYSAGESFGAGGSFSSTRTETRAYSQSGNLFIYDMNLKCISARASIVNFNRLHWNVNFLESLMVLPQSYSTGDDLEDYIEFWETYGTHIVESAEFGGSIRGAVVASSCSVAESFSTTTEYEACLNARYKGLEVEGCGGNSESSTVSSAVDTTLENVNIEVYGGESSTYSQIFNDFTSGSKEQDFDAWIGGLRNQPYIIGGNVDEIHDAIIQAITLGNHHLNEYQVSHPMSDDTFLSIANAMKSAYADYAQQVADETNYFSDTECTVSCNSGFPADFEKCTCTGCNSAEECCFGANGTIKSTPHGLIAFGTMLLAMYRVYLCVY